MIAPTRPENRPNVRELYVVVAIVLAMNRVRAGTVDPPIWSIEFKRPSEPMRASIVVDG